VHDGLALRRVSEDRAVALEIAQRGELGRHDAGVGRAVVGGLRQHARDEVVELLRDVGARVAHARRRVVKELA
jgi:hypothetical protein